MFLESAMRQDPFGTAGSFSPPSPRLRHRPLSGLCSFRGEILILPLPLTMVSALRCFLLFLLAVIRHDLARSPIEQNRVGCG